MLRDGRTEPNRDCWHKTNTQTAHLLLFLSFQKSQKYSLDFNIAPYFVIVKLYFSGPQESWIVC